MKMLPKFSNISRNEVFFSSLSSVSFIWAAMYSFQLLNCYLASNFTQTMPPFSPHLMVLIKQCTYLLSASNLTCLHTCICTVCRDLLSLSIFLLLSSFVFFVSVWVSVAVFCFSCCHALLTVQAPVFVFISHSYSYSHSIRSVNISRCVHKNACSRTLLVLVRLSVRLSVYLSVRLSVCPSSRQLLKYRNYFRKYLTDVNSKYSSCMGYIQLPSQHKYYLRQVSVCVCVCEGNA